jgi:hypothetical protein
MLSIIYISLSPPFPFWTRTYLTSMYLLASSPVCGSTRVPYHLYSAQLTQPSSYSNFRTSTSPLLFLFRSIPEPAGQQGEYIRQAQAKPPPFQDKEPALTGLKSDKCFEMACMLHQKICER